MFKRASQWVFICCLTTVIAACGGGGGGSGGSNSENSTSSSSPSSSSPSSTSSNVTSSGSRTVRITWTAPTTRADGSALMMSALDGYHVFYTRDGADPSEDAVVVINNGGATNADIPLSSAGTYTFAITAVDTNGIESALSTPATITVN